ncbi:MAG: hypothetical protein HFH38_05480 [Lachnospiraceae bacterium]|jgi:hypothetical protein|nr:hypothetical protein [Lachnospiraceae bacterium]
MRLGQGQDIYDDGNIPETDMPQDIDPMEVSIPAPYPINNAKDSGAQDLATTPAEPLPESTRPRQDGPGGA